MINSIFHRLFLWQDSALDRRKTELPACDISVLGYAEQYQAQRSGSRQSEGKTPISLCAAAQLAIDIYSVEKQRDSGAHSKARSEQEHMRPD